MSEFSTRPFGLGDLTAIRRHIFSLSGGPLPERQRVARGTTAFRGKPGAELPDFRDGHHLVHLLTKGILRISATGSAGHRILGFAQGPSIYATSRALEVGLASLNRRDYATGPLEAGFGETVTAATPTSTLGFDAELLWELAGRHEQWMRMMAQLTTLHLVERTARLRDMLVETPEVRYLRTLRDQPDVVRQISQRDLALYVGVTPETLSRIAARVRQRQRTGADVAPSEDASQAS